MPLFIGHRSAELFLNLPVAEHLNYADVPFRYTFASRGRLNELDLHAIEELPRPLDVLVSSRQEARFWSGVKCHRLSRQPPSRAFLEVTPDVYVASPELCLILQAQSLTLAQTVQLGSRFCGTYALDETQPSGVRERRHLTTIENLQTFALSCSDIPGVKRARRATELILPNAASPMEITSALILCLPRRLGGFGLTPPTLNYEQTLHGSAKRLIDKDFIRIDLYWESYAFGLEYQGREHHSSDRDIANDIARQLAAEAQGIDLQMISIEQIRNREQRLYLARKVAKQIGETIDVDEAFLKRNQQLVDELV